MKVDDALLISQLCAARAGLKIDPDKHYMMESRLAPVARRDGFASIADMLVELRARRDEKLIWAVVEAMAFGDTAFFRDAPVFDHLRDQVLPAAMQRREGGAVRIWSAACGSGQEIYSLAMMAADPPASAPSVRIDLYGSDLNERALEKAQSGLFTQFEVQRGLPIRKLVEHFEKQDDMWVISPRIRQMVRWRRINLVGDLSRLGQFDLILCRYVLNSLVEPMQARVLQSMVGALTPGGVLMLSPGDEVAGLHSALRPADGVPGLFERDPAYSAAA